ncbi:MAG TPA: HNH endonuclease family protein, partial [Gemmatimonadaceae bacterium]|nr:HNH endonuclease family protein [Gemmatimonadaceae bacterium]
SFERFRTTGNALARYMLSAIERALRNEKEPELVPNKDVDEVNLEHILPQKPKAGEWPFFSPDDASLYAYRIGNMTLLQKGKNNKIGNKPWSDKKPIIASSELNLNKAIAGSADWTKVVIEARQKDLADLALKVWAL